ncbi:hypothetical protein DPMN_018085 [Dreissena polymorpha]|uniref:Uncharacterized protein n=2 Tax=Dreissena polymorpha TaxID=45954 RepID=A0A9D4NG20_DREPO|nr:hypothetical protein DPMN_018085 [Dreissena polymorpha]
MKTYWLVGLKNPVVAEICPSNNAALTDNKPRPSSGNRRKSIPGNHKSKIKLHNQNSADIENASIPGCVQNHVIETKIDNSPNSVECNPQDSSHDPFKVVLETHRFARIFSHQLGEPKTNELVGDHVRAMTDGLSTTPVTDA